MTDAQQETAPDKQADSLTSAAAAQARQALDRAKQVTVETEDDAAGMTRLVEWCDGKLKRLETARKSLVGPLNKQVKFINDQFREAKQLFEQASREGRERLRPYLVKLDEERRQREAAERKAAEDAAAAALREQERKEAEAAQQASELPPEAPPETDPHDLPPAEPEPESEPPPAPAPPPPPAKTAPKGEKKTARTQKVRKWRLKGELTDVDPEFLKLDEGALTRAVKAGRDDIAGIEVYVEDVVVMR